ncbi:MAG: hypothetical protein J6Q53_04985 [Oscillospiraceae bacterium]|nr:hypothetical protein [Oscillospiraceae bacterium]
MSICEKEYMDADYEVISMVKRGRGSGGELPGKVIRYIPETSRTEAIIALDQRIAKLQKYAPFIIGGATVLLSFLAGMSL